MKPDNWKHRSAGMVCSTCIFFVPKVRLVSISAKQGEIERVDTLPQTTETDLGRCRRHAPTMNGFPAVFKSDWCGDHKLDENKAVQSD